MVEPNQRRATMPKKKLSNDDALALVLSELSSTLDKSFVLSCLNEL
jgi:hypothetical protein